MVGIRGGATTPGSRAVSHNMVVSPGVAANVTMAGAAIPLTAIPDQPTEPGHSLADLISAGVLTEPLIAMPEFMYGNTALDVNKKDAGATPTDVTEFSVRDPQIWVYSLWQQKGKLSKGMVGSKVYDVQNRVRVNVPSKKISLSSTPSRLVFSFPPIVLGPGVARVDVTWDDRPVWRTFVRVTE